MHNSLIKNSVRKGGSGKLINNIRRWMYMIISLYYYKYKCQLRGTGDDYWYQVGNVIFYVPGFSQLI